MTLTERAEEYVATTGMDPQCAHGRAMVAAWLTGAAQTQGVARMADPLTDALKKLEQRMRHDAERWDYNQHDETTVRGYADALVALLAQVPRDAPLKDAEPGTPIGPSTVFSRAVERLYGALSTDARLRLRSDGFSLDPILLALRPAVPRDEPQEEMAQSDYDAIVDAVLRLKYRPERITAMLGWLRACRHPSPAVPRDEPQEIANGKEAVQDVSGATAESDRASERRDDGAGTRGHQTERVPRDEGVPRMAGTRQDAQMRIAVAGRMEKTIDAHVRACEVHLADEQAKPLPDSALIAVLCDSIRMAREYVESQPAVPRDALPAEPLALLKRAAVRLALALPEIHECQVAETEAVYADILAALAAPSLLAGETPRPDYFKGNTAIEALAWDRGWRAASTEALAAAKPHTDVQPTKEPK